MSVINRVVLVAVGLCVTTTPVAQRADAAEATRAAQQSSSEQRVPTNKEELDAVEAARAVLASALYVSPDTLPVLSIERRTWPNSGLGCASPDTATINISRTGYAVALATPDGVRHVHVARRQTRICDEPADAAGDSANAPEAFNTPPPSYDLNAMVQRSREDLARQLRVPVKTVRLVSFAATAWPDNTMDCVVPYELSSKKAVKGYRIQLRQDERTYIYHTDLVRTRACPGIETPPPLTAASARKAAAPAKPSARRSNRSKQTTNVPSWNNFGVAQRYPSP